MDPKDVANVVMDVGHYRTPAEFWNLVAQRHYNYGHWQEAQAAALIAASMKGTDWA